MKTKLIVLIFLLITLLISAGKRYQQYSYWKKHKNVYFVNNTPMMTTLDAYYWLRYAKYVKNGTYSDNDTLRAYPDGSIAPKPPQMLSYIIGKFSKIFNTDVYHIGIYIIPILASLFVIPFLLYFYLNGFPAGGILGALIGTFSYAYYVRSCIGRVDTDSLNLFFPFLASLFIMLASSIKKENLKLIYSALAGLSMLCYTWWYSHPELVPVYFIFFVATVLTTFKSNNNSRKNVIFMLVLFIIFANPLTIFDSIKGIFTFLSNYGSVKETVVVGGIPLPDINKTITETQHQSFMANLRFLFGIPFVSLIGLLAFVVGAALKWRNFIPIMPMFFLGLMVFKSSNRFAMFLAPFAGAGIGIIIDYMFNYFKLKTFTKLISQFIIGLAIFFVLSGKTAFSFIPMPSIPVDIYKSFLTMKKIMPKNSAIFSWWDFGYAYMDVTNRATFHDGGIHGGWRTYLVAKGMVNSNQKELYNIISIFDNHDLRNLLKLTKKSKNIDKFLNFIKNYNKTVSNSNIYVVFTRDMIGKYGAMNFFGKWNFRTKKGFFNGFGELRCSKYSGGVLMCGNINIDLNKAKINNTPLNKLYLIKNGKIIKEVNGSNFSDYFVEILMINNRIFKVYLLKKPVYESNFNQMYLLGKYDRNLFKEVLYFYPSVRIFKIKKISPEVGMK